MQWTIGEPFYGGIAADTITTDFFEIFWLIPNFQKYNNIEYIYIFFTNAIPNVVE